MFKRISAVGVSCVTALVLMMTAITSPSKASADSLEEMADMAISCIMSHEGSYGSINANDCGAVSVGKLQWHADRALQVMRRACEYDAEFAENTLGSSLYNEVMSASGWSYRTFSSSEAKAAAALLSSDYGIAAQDAQASTDVQNYIISGQNKGMTDTGALVLYADIYNFGCGIAASVAKLAASYAGSYEAVTLDDMHKAALNCSYNSNKYFVSRANSVYNLICSMGYGSSSDNSDNTSETPITTTPADQFTEDGAGTYTVTASLLNMRSGAGTGYSIVTTIPGGASVEVTKTGDGWAYASYGSCTGYLSMEYLTVKADTTEPLETTTAEETTTTTAETTTETTTEVTTTETTTTETTTTEISTETTAAETTEASETTTETTAENDGEIIVNSAYASVYGDINGDGEVTVADAVLLHKYLVGTVSLNLEQLANADCSFDGALTMKDATVIMQHLAGHFTALPIL